MNLLKSLKKLFQKKYSGLNFTDEQMAAHAYEVLNLIIGDIVSAIFLDQCTETYEKNLLALGKTNKFIVHYNRNRLRLVSSVLYRYTEIYKKRIKKLRLASNKAETLNQKLHGYQARSFRHLFEHELSQVSQEPHSPEQVNEHLKNIARLFGDNFKQGCIALAKRVLEIRDLIANQYPTCGSGVNRWKIESLNEDVKSDYGAATLTAGCVDGVIRVGIRKE